MTREELISSPDYWVAKTQVDLYNKVKNYLNKNGMSRSALADIMGVTRGYISQILNGNCDHRLSKIFELALAIGEVPTLSFRSLESVLSDDENNLISVPLCHKVNIEYKGESPIYQFTQNEPIELTNTACYGTY